MKVRSVGKTHVGMKRKINEDSYLAAPELGLYVVADGMGGHRAGDVASRLVVETMEDYWQKVKENKAPSFLVDAVRKDLSDGANHLLNSIAFSNMIVHEAQKKPEYHRMGSTISALLVEENSLWAANVGDSRVYVFGNGQLRQLSQDHSLVAEHKGMGLVDPFDSTNPLLKNLLTRVIGLDEKVDIYITPIRPDAADIVMLCSDGLTNYVSEKAIQTVLDDFSMSIERKTDILIDEANQGGGGDNISVILVEVLEEGRWQKLKKRFNFGSLIHVSRDVA
jgi:protein phosphatase